MSIEETCSSTRRLTVLSVAVLGTVALLSIFGQVFVQLALTQQSNDARVVNVAGRQRMLSQKLSKAVLAIQAAANPATRNQRVEELQSVVALWGRSHQGLKQGDGELGLPGINSPEVTRLFDKIELHYQSMLKAAKELLAVVVQDELQE